MSQKLRQILTYAVPIAAVAALVFTIFTAVGPERIEFERPGERGSSQVTVEGTYLVSLDKDVVTIGKRANVTPYGLKSGPDASVTLERTPPGASPKDSTWAFTASDEVTVSVLLNGEVVETATLEVGDVITIYGAEVVFAGSREGLGGSVDWWESNKITHLFASPEIISGAFEVVLRAFPVSLVMVLVSFALAIPGGLALAFMKMAKSAWFRMPATAYVDVIRGTPIFLQITLVFFGLPLMPFYEWMLDVIPQMSEAGLLGIDNSAWLRAFLVLSLNSAAYMAEIFRAGIQSISKGQTEAARSLGMTTPQAMTYVIIPQTVRRILPTMMSEFILLFKDTSLFSAVGMGEMMMRSREVVTTKLNVSPYLLAAGFYLVITIPLGRLVQSLENRLARSEGGGMATFDKSVEDNAAALAAKKAAAEAAAAARAGEEARGR